MKLSGKMSLVALLFVSFAVGAEEVHSIVRFKYRNAEELKEAEQRATEKIKNAYETLPDVRNCQSGWLKYDEKRKALKELNAIRRAHGLEEVGYDTTKDKFTAASALIMAANNTLTHYPDIRMKCYSKNGYEGSRKGNLHLFSAQSAVLATDNYIEESIRELLIDDNVVSLGHRFWFLDPFLGDISYGRSTDFYKTYIDSAVVYIGNQRQAVPNTRADYVAYPYKNYKSQWFMHDWFSSFSVIVDKNNPNNNLGAVDYSQAKISVSNSNGKYMKISDIKYTPINSTSVAGLGNSIQWRAIGTKNNERYYVKISNVLVNGKVQNYDYWFEIK